MKYCKTFCIYAALLIVMCGIWIEDGAAQTWMPDTVLRAKVLAQLQAGDSTITEITETNIATLTTLNAVGTTGNKISDLTGLEKATSLTTLRLQSNSISDISALAGLTSLTDLRLYSNNISDISPLKNLSSLIQVWLQGNTNLSDISALSVKAKAGQPAKLSLNQVWLQATKVTDISPLEGAFDPHWANAVLGMPNTIYATDTNIAILMSMISDGPQHFYFHSTQYIKSFTQQPGIPLTADAWRALLPAEPPPPPPPPADALRIVETDPVTNESLTVKRINDRTVTLSWNIPTSLNARTITEFQYSIDGGQTWISTGSTNTSITITGDGFGNLSRDKFKIRSLSLNADGTALVVTAIISAPSKRIIISQCPVGWIRGSVVGQSKKAIIYEVKVDVDLTNRSSIYTLKSLAIYVHPDEGLETLEGWYLTTGPLYNHNPSRKFHLTAENSVIDEQGFAHIKNPDTPPIRMGTLGFIGQRLPSFDYRLYDDRGKRVDFGISCYKEGGLTGRLWHTKDPSVVRVLPLVESERGLKEMLRSLNWDAFFYRSEWTAAILPDSPAETAPAAPSRGVMGVVGKWADLKKQ